MKSDQLVPYTCYRVYRDAQRLEYWDVVYIKSKKDAYSTSLHECMVIRTNVTSEGVYKYGDMGEWGMFCTDKIEDDEEAVKFARFMTL